jgi:hypothetical protein
MVGRKTHEQFLRNLERKPDLEAPVREGERPPPVGAPEGDFLERLRRLNQESEHNKHNHPPKGAQKH